MSGVKRARGPSYHKRSPSDTTRYVTTRSMAAATQTARTSPQNSKMSSPKDSKNSLLVVTKTEGVYALAVASPSCISLLHTPLLSLPAAARASLSLPVVAMLKHD